MAKNGQELTGAELQLAASTILALFSRWRKVGITNRKARTGRKGAKTQRGNPDCVLWYCTE